jgi:hypothetical protein
LGCISIFRKAYNLALGSISHPHVVELLGFDWFEAKPYYIMEFY